MFDFSTAYIFLKIVLLFLVFIVCKTLYEYVYIPLKYRFRYSKYKNVHMAEKFVPLLGDISLMIQNDKDKKSKFHHFIDESLERKGYDLRLVALGSNIFIDVCSIKALDEAEKLIPFKIDRDDMKGLPLENIIGGSFLLSRSDEKSALRRKQISKLLAINHSSQYIPLMIETMDKHIQAAPLDQEISFTELFAKVAYEIITKIFFGKDITEHIGEMEYICPNTGKKLMLDFQEFYEKTVADQLATLINPKGRIFSFLAQYNLIEPFKSNAKNLSTYKSTLVKYLDSCKNQDSIYHTIYASGKFTKEECVMDAISMLFAGFDTSSHLLASTVILLKRNPDKLSKLFKEIKDYKITNIIKLPQEQYKTAYDQSDYLNYVMKESQRIDNPTIASITYQAVEDCEITGVQISKGDRLEMNIMHTHHNPEQWHRPEEFLPERFDPHDELFFKPGTKEVRHPKSYIPFIFGPRNCLGQSLARMELKVLLCRFLTTVEFEIKDELMQNSKLRYHVLEGRHLYGKITSKK